MRAHVVENGVVVNTVEVETLNVIHNLVAAETGTIGDLWDGVTFTPPQPTPRDIIADITALEAQVTPRRIREAINGTDAGWLLEFENKIAIERAKIGALQ